MSFDVSVAYRIAREGRHSAVAAKPVTHDCKDAGIAEVDAGDAGANKALRPRSVTHRTVRGEGDVAGRRITGRQHRGALQGGRVRRRCLRVRRMRRGERKTYGCDEATSEEGSSRMFHRRSRSGGVNQKSIEKMGPLVLHDGALAVDPNVGRNCIR